MSSDCDVIRCRYPEFAPRSVAVAGGWVLRKVRRTSAVRSRVDAGEASFRSWATSGSLVRSRCRCPETDGVVVPVPGEPVERRSLLAVQAEVAEVVEGLSNELGDLPGSRAEASCTTPTASAPPHLAALSRALDRTRTCGLPLRRRSLYPPELRGRGDDGSPVATTSRQPTGSMSSRASTSRRRWSTVQSSRQPRNWRRLVSSIAGDRTKRNRVGPPARRRPPRRT